MEVILNNGVKFPVIGGECVRSVITSTNTECFGHLFSVGTYLMSDKPILKKIITESFKLGYRLIGNYYQGAIDLSLYFYCAHFVSVLRCFYL